MTERLLPPDDLTPVIIEHSDGTKLEITHPHSPGEYDCMHLFVKLKGTAFNEDVAKVKEHNDLLLQHVHMYNKLTLDFTELSFCYSAVVKAFMSLLTEVRVANERLRTSIQIKKSILWQTTSLRAMAGSTGCHMLEEEESTWDIYGPTGGDYYDR